MFSLLAVPATITTKPGTCATAKNMDAFKLMKELKTNHEQEVHYLPKETGLHLIESTLSVRTGPSGGVGGELDMQSYVCDKNIAER